MDAKILVGTAGWAIRPEHASLFPGTLSHLERYAATLDVVEINSSFYHSHRVGTYARWAASVPGAFRFCVKMPRAISHEARLARCEAELEAFLAEAAPLGDKLGAFLLQLPPGFAYDRALVRRFLSALRARTQAPVACEPRHATWFTPEVAAVLQRAQVARVGADPAVVPAAAEPAGWGGLTYVRLHGSPRMYVSAYEPPFLARLLGNLPAARGPVYVIFDNTARGAAPIDALALRRLISTPREGDFLSRCDRRPQLGGRRQAERP